MRLLTELLITAMESVGLVFVALGLGIFASTAMGTGGFFLVAGVGLLAAAYLSARQQRNALPQPPAPPGSPPLPPVTLSRNGLPTETENEPREKLTQRIKKAFT